MKRKITSHVTNGLNEELEIVVLDEPGHGNASHRYYISPKPLQTANTENSEEISRLVSATCLIVFQNGPIQEVGVNGISNEALLAVVEDRLISFQAGQFSCRENAIALTHIQEALMWLQKRTRDRVARGVEGLSVK